MARSPSDLGDELDWQEQLAADVHRRRVPRVDFLAAPPHQAAKFPRSTLTPRPLKSGKFISTNQEYREADRRQDDCQHRYQLVELRFHLWR
jgi:hypothetical protein